MIDFQNVSFTYEGMETPSLKNLNLHIAKGEFVLLLGPSGCGKTTVTRLINGLAPEFFEGQLQGNVLVAGKNTREVYVSELSRDVGSVFQDPSSQFFTTDTTSELVFSCENQGMERGKMAHRLEDITERFSLHPLLDRSIFALSAGEKQRIAIGSVCAYGSDILN